MSIDIFGRRLASGKIKSVSSRGPPGAGFKITIDNQYDIDNKRLCNIAYPQEPTDAVSLKSLEDITQRSYKAFERTTTEAFEQSMRQALEALESKLNARIAREHCESFEEDQRIWIQAKERIAVLKEENESLEKRLAIVENNTETLSQHYIHGVPIPPEFLDNKYVENWIKTHEHEVGNSERTS